MALIEHLHLLRRLRAGEETASTLAGQDGSSSHYQSVVRWLRELREVGWVEGGGTADRTGLPWRITELGRRVLALQLEAGR